jgi:X-Pro dipeptidyl-peptidase-like protein
VRKLCALIASVAALGVAAIAPGVAAAELTPFGHACAVENGVRFCPTTEPAARVPSFDEVPLDVDVTLPETGDGPFPTIVMMHAAGGSKKSWETTSPLGEAPETPGRGAQRYHYNNNFYARRGYAVVTYTVRGIDGSCGGAAGEKVQEGACIWGYGHLDDQRFEARDAQWLLGLLADEGIAKPRKIGVTGGSFGASAALELAFLRNRIRRPDGSLAPWRSPAGEKMEIAAAWPRWGWSDFMDVLAPNGRFSDQQKAAPKWQSLQPVGIFRQSFSLGVGDPTGYYCGATPQSTPCPYPDADVPAILGYISAGRPVSPTAQSVFEMFYRYHGAYGLRFTPHPQMPSPLLIENGFTDGIVAATQGLRVYKYLRSVDPKFPVFLQLGDLGHPRAANKPRVHHYFNDQAAHFFAKYLQGKKRGPRPGEATVFTQTCPLAEPDGGPFTARSWAGLQKGAFRIGSKEPQEFNGEGGDEGVAATYDPIFGTKEGCATLPFTPEPNTAVYSRTVEKGFTMIGLPRVEATIASSGENGQIDARVWDISPEGKQLLVTRGVYALENGQSGKIDFELFGNAYHFAAGHTIEVQLLGRDYPYFSESPTPFGVAVREARISLPSANREPR